MIRTKKKIEIEVTALKRKSTPAAEVEPWRGSQKLGPVPMNWDSIRTTPSYPTDRCLRSRSQNPPIAQPRTSTVKAPPARMIDRAAKA